MINIWSFLFLQAKREIDSQKHGIKFFLFIFVLFIWFFLFQLEWGANSRSWDIAYTGWICSGIFIVMTIFGLLSNRIPGLMQDVIWLYTAPYSFTKIVYSILLWRLSWKGLLCLLSGITADAVYFLAGNPFGRLTAQSIRLLCLIVLLESWIMAMSCARTVKGTKIAFSFVAFILTVIYGIALYGSFFQANELIWQKYISYHIGFIGYLFTNSFLLQGFLAFLIMIALSFMIIRITTKKSECKEKLVKEADFWAEFQDHQTDFFKNSLKEMHTWWGLKGLNGIFSFLWLEILLAKKYIFFHATHLFVLLILVPVFIAKNIYWFYILVVFTIGAFFSSSYYSGLIRHAKSGDLFLLPGKLWKKALLLEGSNTAWIFLFYLYCVGMWHFHFNTAFTDFLSFGLYGLGGYMFMLSIRWAAFVRTYKKDPSLSLISYYKNFAFICMGSTLCYILLFFLFKNLLFYWLPLFMIVLSTILFLSFYQYEH